MTVREAVERADGLYPNVFSFSEKAAWTDELDKKVYSLLYSRYKDSERVIFSSESPSPDRELLIKEPYENLYTLYIAMKLDIFNSDMARYENSSALFNSEYKSFADFYNRSHEIISCSVSIE